MATTDSGGNPMTLDELMIATDDFRNRATSNFSTFARSRFARRKSLSPTR
jgi:hypothetical protein